MSTLQVANVVFNATGNNRIEYLNDGILRATAGAIRLPIGGTAARPTAEAGLIRYNSDTGTFEGRNSSAWGAIGGAGGGATINNNNTSVDLHYVTFTSAISGTATTLNVSSNALTFNAATGTLSATVLNSLSDIHRKYGISQIMNGTEKVEKLRGVEFYWSDNHQKSSGVIAQEISLHLPHLVDSANSVNYSGIIPYLIESIKELNNRIIMLENKLNGK